MKLGEALTVRARQAQRLNDLLGRIKASSVTQEGDTPAEDVRALIDDYLSLSDEHSLLVARITKTNVALIVEGDRSLLDLLQQRERLVRQRNLYSIVAKTATTTPDSFRYMRNEIKFVPQVNVAELRSVEEKRTADIAVLDVQIQQINWQADLI